MNQKILAFILSAIFVSSISMKANAFPMPKGPDNHRMIAGNSTYNFNGIVALDDCSGAIIRFENSKITDPAMVLTNGHCYEGGMPKPGTFIYHQQSARTFGVFNDHAQGIGTIHAAGVIYSTMTGTDITLYQLKETFQQIQTSFQVNPLLLSSKHPAASTPIEVISGYWRRGYSCTIETFVFQLREAGWMSQDSMRYSRPGCETIGGTSGSPVLEAGTRTMIGINNTGNDNGQKCTMDNPCEVDKAGNVTAVKGYSYAQQTYEIYSCLNQANQFDLSVPGCALLH